jgi:Trypsin
MGAPRDELQAYTESARELADLVAAGDERRSLEVLVGLLNAVDTALARPAAPARTRGAAAAADPASVSNDPVFLANARRMTGDRTRIVGGIPTADYADCVAVGDAHGWCGSGTVVGPRVVLTAAHCALGEHAQVLVGDDVADPHARVVPVGDIVPHPDFTPPPRTSHDLCVLLLDEDAGVEPRRIAEERMLTDAVSVRLAGYGRTDVGGTTGYGRRRVVDVPIAASDPRYGADPESEFVAGAPFLDRDACTGDSGGPAYVQADDGWYLAGATSRATASSFRRCGDGGIHTWVRAYARWIRDVAGGGV